MIDTSKLKKWDMADHINTPEDVIAYLDAALEDNDPELLAAVLGDIARSRGMSEVARASGLTREGLYRSLSETGKPTADTLFKVFAALGIRLHATIDAPGEAKREAIAA